MPELIPVLSKDEINKAVADIAKKISSDYKGNELVMIGILKGAFVFISDLIRYMTIPVQIDFIRVASYGTDSSSSGKIKLLKELELNIRNKHVLVIEDIVDTGLTLSYLLDYLKSFKPESVKVCTLINKKERRKISIEPDYACHVAKEGFLVGYGLDYAEDYRELPAVYHLKL